MTQVRVCPSRWMLRDSESDLACDREKCGRSDSPSHRLQIGRWVPIAIEQNKTRSADD